MSHEEIKLDDEINRIPFVISLVLLVPVTRPGTYCPREFIRADGVEISEIYHLNNTYYSKSYLYRTRYNKNSAFENLRPALNHFHCSFW